MTHEDLKFKVSGKSTVELTKCNKKEKTVVIPKTITVEGKTYKITKIDAKAFSGNKYVKSVTIGANIKRIEAKAFYRCKNLSNITIKGTSLRKVQKYAFAKLRKGCKIKIITKDKKAYKKIRNLIKTSIIGKSIKIQRKSK